MSHLQATTLEEYSTKLLEYYADFHELKTERKFTEGEIVEYKADEPKKGYYKETDTEFDLRKGDLCVIASFGGPRDMVVDRIVNDEVVRYAVDFAMIKKVKTK